MPQLAAQSPAQPRQFSPGEADGMVGQRTVSPDPLDQRRTERQRQELPPRVWNRSSCVVPAGTKITVGGVQTASSPLALEM